MVTKVGVAGVGTLGTVIANALLEGIDGYELVAISEKQRKGDIKTPSVSFAELAKRCDLVIEALPAAVVPELAQECCKHDTDIMMLSSSALLNFPENLRNQKQSNSRISVPPGALSGFDGVNTLRSLGLKSAKIISTKPPRSFEGAPHILENGINLGAINEKICIFSGNAMDVARAFPANANVAVTFALASLGPENTEVAIWADPGAEGNSHEITVASEFSAQNVRIDNKPDPNNPKSSIITAHSVLAVLRGEISPAVTFQGFDYANPG